MMHRKHRKRLYGLAFLSGIALVVLWSASARAESDPWTAAQTVKPRQL
jgi:hypothetical protein